MTDKEDRWRFLAHSLCQAVTLGHQALINQWVWEIEVELADEAEASAPAQVSEDE